MTTMYRTVEPIPLVRWAEDTARVKIHPLPAKLETLRNLVIQHRRDEPVRNEIACIVTYVRHVYTNYDNLVVHLTDHKAEEGPALAVDALRKRVGIRILAALDKQYGEEWRG